MTTLPLSPSFIDAIAAVQRVLDAFAQQGVIIGGVAASLLGKPRTTADVDTVILLPTPEDLIIQKAVAHRPKDLLDIGTIIDSHPNLDWDRIQFWVQQFAEALEIPELWQDIAKMRPKGKRRK